MGAIYLDRGYDACMKLMKQRIVAKMINIDKVAYKEVNFKSKLIEWEPEEPRRTIEFVLCDQKKDGNGNPMFTFPGDDQKA